MTTPDPQKPDGDWRSRTRFRQGERIGEDAPERAAPSGRIPLMPMLIAGGAMLAASAILRAMLDSGAVAFAGGLAVGALVLLVLLRRRRSPRPARAVAPTAGVDAAAVAESLARAEAELSAIDAAAGALEPAVAQELDAMTAAARKVLDDIADDPKDLDRARRFVVAYLPSARRAVEKYVALGVKDPDLTQQFRDLVAEMTETCRRQQETLRADDRFELEVEIDTLADRLKTER